MKGLHPVVWLCGGALLVGGCATGSKETVVERVPLAHLTPGIAQTNAVGTATVTIIPVRAPTYSLAVGEGAVWVAGRKCVKIDARSNRVIGTFPEASSCNLAVGEGSLWAARIALFSHGLSRIDPETGKVLARIPGIGGLPVLGEGSVWVHSGRGTVFRIDPKTDRLVATIKTPGVGVRLAIGESAVWALEQTSFWPGSEGLLSRIDPAKNQVAETIRLGPGTCMGVAVGEGAVWVAQSRFNGGKDDSYSLGGGSRGKILRIDPNSNKIVRAIPLDDQPLSIAVGGGSIWVSTWRGRLARIEPKTDVVTEEFPIPGRDYRGGLFIDTAVAAEGALWLGGLPGHEVYRIDF